MTWLYLALLSGFFSATADALAKSLSRDAGGRLLAWMCFCGASPWLLLLWLFTDPGAPADNSFWLALAITLPLEFACFNHALTLDDLSLVVPLLALTPLFLLIIPKLVLGETVSEIGAAGILCVVIGAYLLNVTRLPLNMVAPLQAIWRSRGARFAIAAAMLYAITSTFGKMMVEHSSPLFVAAIYYPIVSVATAPLVLWREPQVFVKFQQRWLRFLLLGMVVGLTILFHFFAIADAPVAYMIAVKRSSMIFAILYGWRLYREGNLRYRIAAGLIMLAGIFLIANG